MNFPRVAVSAKGARRLASGHPWIFRSDVTEPGSAEPGDVVQVTGPKGQLLGTGHFSSTSQITIRLLDDRSITADRAFFRQRILDARLLRDALVKDTDAYRLVHAEADRLPGLIIDRYGNSFVLQLLTQGMDRAVADIVDVLRELFAPEAIVSRNDSPARRHENLRQEKRVLAGNITGPVSLHMNGLLWQADLFEGQKTGVFLDQRENYLAAARHASGHALDCFTCAGGFALHLAGRCTHVEAIDSSGAALTVAQRNAEANNFQNIQFREADVFDLLKAYATARRPFDIVVLDPPAFAKSRVDLGNALRAYRDLNLRALKLLKPGGILVSCSCSHHIAESMLLETIAQASLETGRMLRILERRTQSSDHPILLTVPETMYLKCLILQVV